MEKLYITEDIANHPANEGKGLVVGNSFDDPGTGELDTCGGKDKPEPPKNQQGHYSCVLNEWVWVPAP